VAELVLSSPTAGDTRAIGEAIGGLLAGGDVVSLTGDLGAGKTTFVQGAARSLGIEQPVLSPTFTLVREYRGRVPVYHLDVYRLERIQDVVELGFDELVDAGGVVFVEWGDGIDRLLPPDHLRIELTLAGEGEVRELRLDPRGRAWEGRAGALREAVRSWSSG
jgi:tRNA threonylcarbamoyladenosine biosynthesis protein TsaE